MPVFYLQANISPVCLDADSAFRLFSSLLFLSYVFVIKPLLGILCYSNHLRIKTFGSIGSIYSVLLLWYILKSFKFIIKFPHIKTVLNPFKNTVLFEIFGKLDLYNIQLLLQLLFSLFLAFSNVFNSFSCRFLPI